MSAPTIPTFIVNSSTSIVLIDSSQISQGSYALVYLSNVDYPGTVVTVRDYKGYASPTKQILLSTTKGLQFQNGSFSTLINQPFGFVTVISAPPFSWQILNTYAFANISQAAYIRNFNTDVFYTSTVYATAGGFFSTISVGTSLFVGESFSTFGSTSLIGPVYMGSDAIVTGNLIVVGTTTFQGTPSIDGDLFVKQSTLLDGIVYISSFATLSSFSSLGDAAIGGSLAVNHFTTLSSFSSLGDAAIGGSLFINNSLVLNSLSSISSSWVGGNSRTVGNAFIEGTLTVSSFATLSSFSTLGNAAITGLLTVRNGISTATLTTSGRITANGGITVPSSQTISGAGFETSVNTLISGAAVDVTQVDTLRIAKTGTLTSGLVLDVSGAAAFSGKVGIGKTTVGTNALDVTGDFSVTGGGHIQGGATCGTIATDTGVERLRVYGAIYATGDMSAFSDVRFKTNISTIENALEKINALRGVYYTPLSNLSTQKIGVIAQEIEEHFPQLVQTDSSEQAIKSVAYGNITAILIEGIKELTQRAISLEAMVSTLQG